MKRTLMVAMVSAAMLIPFGRNILARPAKPGVEPAVRAVLEAQVTAWNRGDIHAFMQTYWNSDRTEFIGSNGIVRGWQSVLARYRKSYPDQRSMGTLTFSNLEITALSPTAALAVGEWRLEREGDHPAGVFTLVFRKLPQGWRIINDHTSAYPKK